jgi:hypothetical protein
MMAAFFAMMVARRHHAMVTTLTLFGLIVVAPIMGTCRPRSRRNSHRNGRNQYFGADVFHSLILVLFIGFLPN